MTTRVRRLSPQGQPIVQSIPCCPASLVLSDGVKVKYGKVQINLASDASDVSWHSRLEVSPDLALKAPKQVPWVEQWSVTASRIWICRSTASRP